MPEQGKFEMTQEEKVELHYLLRLVSDNDSMRKLIIREQGRTGLAVLEDLHKRLEQEVFG